VSDPRRSESFGGAVMVGAHSGFMVIDTAAQAAVLGISFRPGGAFPFLNMPAGELRDLHVPLDTLWKAEGSTLRERLLDAPTPDAKFSILESFLLSRARKPLARHPAVSFALNEMQKGTIADVTEQLGWSPKRFIQIFRDEVGLTPKLFCRIRRFQEVLHQIQSQQQLDWADIAISCGYFDQAHFVHDFRAFAGMTPTAYEMLRGTHQNHIPLPD